jgi:uncharacterized protein (DUF305 family)
MRNLILLSTLAITTIGLGCAPKQSNTAANHSGMDHSKMDHSAMKSSPNAASAPYDLQFLDTMIVHHQGAIHMAEPARAKGHHAEIITLAKNITSSQKQEIEQMKAWRDKWFPGAAPAINIELAGMHDSMKGMNIKQFDMLHGNEFDLEFIRQMIPHHEGALVMAREALQRSTKDEIKTLANAIIKAQEAEIAQMKQWQAEWTK